MSCRNMLGLVWLDGRTTVVREFSIASEAEIPVGDVCRSIKGVKLREGRERTETIIIPDELSARDTGGSLVYEMIKRGGLNLF